MSTNLYTQEKTPLLPLNNEEECQRVDCVKNKLYRAKYKRLGVFFFILFINIFLSNGFSNNISRYINGNEAVSTSSPKHVTNVPAFDTMAEFRIDEKMDTNSRQCISKPSIPYTGLSKFEFNANEFSKLSIKEKLNTKNKRQYVSLVGGEAVVYQDSTISKVMVEFDLKLDREELQDEYWIESIQHTEEGLYELNVKINDEADENLEGCVTIDIIVRVPNVADIEDLSLSVYNGGVVLKEGLTFEKLDISIANGHLEFKEGISSGKTDISLANGHVSGTIDTLSDNFSASIANGHSKVIVKEIDQTKDISIKFNLANGFTDLQVPKTFNSTFGLYSFVGKRVIESSSPQDIHIKTNSWGKTVGYYGDNDQTKNSIALSSSNGRINLNYA